DLLQAHVWVDGIEVWWVGQRAVIENLIREGETANGWDVLICGRVTCRWRTRRGSLALDVFDFRAGQTVERRSLLMPVGGKGDRREGAEDGDDNDRHQRDRHHGFDQAEAALRGHFNAPTRPYIAEIIDTAMNPTMMPTATVITGSISDVIARIRYSSSPS